MARDEWQSRSSLVTLHLYRASYFLRGATPGPFFFTLGLREPRGSVRFGLTTCFFRAARFSFLRSALSVIFLVFIIWLIAGN